MAPADFSARTYPGKTSARTPALRFPSPGPVSWQRALSGRSAPRERSAAAPPEASRRGAPDPGRDGRPRGQPLASLFQGWRPLPRPSLTLYKGFSPPRPDPSPSPPWRPGPRARPRKGAQRQGGDGSESWGSNGGCHCPTGFSPTRTVSPRLQTVGCY